MPCNSQFLNSFSPRLVGDEELIKETADDCFTYHQWDEGQIEQGTIVRAALQIAFEKIIAHVPPCPDRAVALRKLREARMDCNSAITHQGRY